MHAKICIYQITDKSIPIKIPQINRFAKLVSHDSIWMTARKIHLYKYNSTCACSSLCILWYNELVQSDANRLKLIENCFADFPMLCVECIHNLSVWLISPTSMACPLELKAALENPLLKLSFCHWVLSKICKCVNKSKCIV